MSAKPNGVIVRHMRVIADQPLRPTRPVAFEVAVRAAAIAIVALLILGLLPAIVEAAA